MNFIILYTLFVKKEGKEKKKKNESKKKALRKVAKKRTKSFESQYI
jgi:hypothetical protein